MPPKQSLYFRIRVGLCPALVVIFQQPQLFLPLTFPLPPFFQLLIPLLRLGGRAGQIMAIGWCGGEGGAVQTMRHFIFTTVSQLSALFPINQSDSASALLAFSEWSFCPLFENLSSNDEI